MLITDRPSQSQLHEGKAMFFCQFFEEKQIFPVFWGVDGIKEELFVFGKLGEVVPGSFLLLFVKIFASEVPTSKRTPSDQPILVLFE